MRRFLLAAAVFGLACGAQAADMPDFLRGSLPASSAPTRNWDGWYAGGEIGYTSADMDFGHNYQWDDLVFGVEANYNYVNSLSSSVTNSMSRGIVNPAGSNPPAGHTYTYNMTLAGNAALQVKDVMTFRGRAGWAYDNFLPYIFGGVAVGRMSVSRQASVTGNLQDLSLIHISE